MTDYTAAGAVPVDDAAVSDPPTVDEVQQRQEEEFPEQARTAMHHPSATAVLEAGGDEVDDQEDVRVEGPNSA